MKTVSSAMLAQFAANTPVFLAELYTFTLVDGTVLRFTSFDRPITFSGHTFANSLGFKRSTWKQSVGLSVDALNLTITARPGNLLSGVPIIQAIGAGRFDGAQVDVERVYMATPGDVSAGSVKIFMKGIVGDITEVGMIQAQMKVESKLKLLNIGLPRSLYQPGCRHTLFDAGCTLSRAPYLGAGTFIAGSTTSVVQSGLANIGATPAPTSAPTLTDAFATGVNLPAAHYYVVITYVTSNGETLASPEGNRILSPNHLLTVAPPPSASGVTGWNVYIGLGPGDGQKQNPAQIAIGTSYTMQGNGIYQSGQIPPALSTAGYWALGTIAFTSGANTGLSRMIEASDISGALQLRVPVPVAPAVGDTYSITPGCDRTKASCLWKFNNLIHFGGFPYIPTPEVGA